MAILRSSNSPLSTLSLLLTCCLLVAAPKGWSNEGLESFATFVEAMPENSWAKANLNTFKSVWPPCSLRPGCGTSYENPEKIIKAWSSFAWDTKRHSLILYGGGHGNYMGNEVYMWDAETREWRRASLPSDITYLAPNGIPVDGAINAPQSAHTYDNALYLPVADRYFNFGGAAFNSGGAYQTGGSGTPRTGPYTFDPSKADPNSVGGTTGSGVDPGTFGAQMWHNRNTVQAASAPVSFVGGTTANAVENGKDVIYLTARSGGGTDRTLYRYTIHDPADPSEDTWERIGASWYASGGQGAGAYDRMRQIYVRTGNTTVDFQMWRIDPPHIGPNNREVRINIVNKPDGFEQHSRWGLDYDPVRNRFLLWNGGGEIYALKVGSTTDPDGDGWINDWTLTKIALADVAVIPEVMDASGGALGKWKYAPDLDMFVGLSGTVNGNVWLYKPAGWINPFAPVTFTDVPDTSWAFSYISTIAAAGITTGCGGGNYCPANNVTRDQMAAFLVRAKEGEPAAGYCGGVSPFTDVGAAYWACGYIKRLSELSITTGCGGSNYCPNGLVTRQEMAAFIVRAAQGDPPANYCAGVAPFADVDPSSWACGYIKRLKELGVTTGCGGSNYCPNGLVTRQDMAAFLGRAFLGM